jgi:cytochrome o ubiquinol oxidase operon protein cyoD
MSQPYRPYFIGFGLSLVLTLASFGLVWARRDSDNSDLAIGLIVAVLAVLALGQLVTQLVFFFHMAHEESPRLNTWSFVFMALVVAILIGGSIWIMFNLHSNMEHNPIDIQQQENIHKDMDMGS